MGVINITQRSERLGNLGGTSMAHGVTNTNIGQVHHTVARTFSPHYYNRNSHAGDGAIAAGLGKVGDTLVRIGAAVIQREEDRKVDDFANAMLDSMERQGRDDRDIDDWNTPDRKHLEGQKKGFYLRTGVGTKTVVEEWDRAFGDTFRIIGGQIDANDRVRERTMEKLASYRRSTIAHLADKRNSEYRRIELGSAKGNLEAQIDLWQNGKNNSPTVLDEIFAQKERVDTLSLATPEQRKANSEKLALVLARSCVGKSLDQCQTPEDFDKVEKLVKGGLKGALPDKIAENLPGGERTVGGENQKALLDDVRRARQSFEIQRDREEREQLSELVAFSDNALAKGGMDDLEAAHKDMSERAKKMPKGSRMETVALQQAKRLGDAADGEARRLTWDAILEHAGDKTPWTPPKDSRMAKFYKQMKESYDRQAQAYMADVVREEEAAILEERKANVAALRMSMMESASIDPGAFSARLADASQKGHITLDQYQKLREEFSNVWMKEGMPQKAAALVQVLKNEFYQDKDYDLQDRLSVDKKSGRFEYFFDPETKKPIPGEDLEWKIAETVKGRKADRWEWALTPESAEYFSKDRTVWREKTFTSNEQLSLLNWALELAAHEGEWTSVDPQTGERLDKPRKINAVQEFGEACRRIRMMGETRTAQELCLERAMAITKLGAGLMQLNDTEVEAGMKRDAAERMRKRELKKMKRKPFEPKMPGRRSRAPSPEDEYTED